jgi:hypothetical protein
LTVDNPLASIHHTLSDPVGSSKRSGRKNAIVPNVGLIQSGSFAELEEAATMSRAAPHGSVVANTS